MNSFRCFFFNFIFLFAPIFLEAQQFTLSGKVIDNKTQQEIEFVNLFLKKAQTGGLTDEHGKFLIKTEFLPDTLIISFIGYKKVKLFIDQLHQERMVIKLEEDETILSQVTVSSYKDYGKYLMKQVIANKSKNDINRFDNSVCNEYRKMEIDVRNIDPNSKGIFFSKIASVYNSFNDSTENVAPIYFIERFLRLYRSSKLQTHVEHELATKKLGLSTDQLASKLDKFDIRINIYNPVIPILKTSFLSPVSDLGLLYYKFIPVDTLMENEKKIIKLQLQPKIKNENTFIGYLWIDEENYGITKVDIQIGKDNNINFIEQLSFKEDFTHHQDENDAKQSYWIPQAIKTTIAFQNGFDLIGIPVPSDTSSQKIQLTSSSAYNDYIINSEKITPTNYYKFKSNADTTLEPLENNQFVDSFRIEKLSARELAIYKTMDSLKSNKLFVAETKLTTLFVTGYWDFGCKLRVGPLSSVLSTNQIEGLRGRLSFWTLPCIHKNLNLNGYAAYGSKDKVLKGGLGLKYVPSIDRYCKTEILFRKDFDVLLDFDDELDDDNIFTLALSKNIPAYKVFTQQVKMLQEIDLNHNWSAKVYGSVKTMTPTFNYTYYKEVDDQIIDYTPLKKLSTTEVGTTLRYAHNERTTIFNYDKIRIFSSYPVFALNFVYGFEGAKTNYFNYAKITSILTQELNLPIKGSIFYYASAGQMFGTVPALLLFAPQGNAYYVSNKYRFNNMLPYEFAADRYASVMIRYNMGGMILDKVPLINKLKLRERIIFNNYWGTLSSHNREYNNINPLKTTGNIPYSEAGFGIGNILKVMSVDAIWRLSQFNNAQPLTRFGIYTSITIVF